jgi:hypothetical protein
MQKNKNTNNKQRFNPRIEVFSPFRKPFAEEPERNSDPKLENIAACCACTACTACR